MANKNLTALFISAYEFSIFVEVRINVSLCLHALILLICSSSNLLHGRRCFLNCLSRKSEPEVELPQRFKSYGVWRQSARCHTPEDLNLYQHRCENLISPVYYLDNSSPPWDPRVPKPYVLRFSEYNCVYISHFLHLTSNSNTQFWHSVWGPVHQISVWNQGK
jgi:hypothetical protein